VNKAFKKREFLHYTVHTVRKI